MNRRVSGVAVAICVLVLIGAWLLRPAPGLVADSDAPASAESAVPEVDAGGDKAVIETAGIDQPPMAMRRDVAPAPKSTWQPLPPTNLPLAGVHAVLKSRADRGDAQAACRLAAELGHCRKVMFQRDYQPEDPEPGSDAQRVTSRALWEARFAHCGGVQKSWLADEVGYTRQAALAGNLAAIESYVSATAFDRDLYAGSIYLEDYRREAPKLAEAAVQAGSFAMLREYEAAFQYLARVSLFSRAIQSEWSPDQLRRVQWLMGEVLSDKSGENYRRAARKDAETTMTSAEIKSLEQSTKARFETWFKGRKQPFSIGGFGLWGDARNPPDFNLLCTGASIDRPLEVPAINWQE